MKYYKTESGYLVSPIVITSALATEITEAEYKSFIEIINSKPIPPSGYDYILNDVMEWVLYELPIVEEEATDADYQNALREMGVTL